MNYETFTAVSFRCFERVTLEGLARVNLLTGQNNVGKTALLEAIAVHAGFADPQVVVDLHGIRSGGDRVGDPHDVWWWLFRHRNAEAPVRLQGAFDDRVTRTVEISARQSRRGAVAPVASTSTVTTGGAAGPVEIVFGYSDSASKESTAVVTLSRGGVTMNPVQNADMPRTALVSTGRTDPIEEAGLVSRAIEEGDDGYLVEAVRLVDDRVARVFPLVKGGIPVLYVQMDAGPPIPLSLLGEGCRRMVTLALRMRTNDVVLVDELENGVHHSALERVWRGIERLAQAAGTQVFVTTHSYECIRAAAHGLCAGAARLYRFERRDGGTVVVAADGEALRAAVAEGLEVR